MAFALDLPKPPKPFGFDKFGLPSLIFFLPLSSGVAAASVAGLDFLKGDFIIDLLLGYYHL
ncbi:hypothetical protein [Moraxella lacunata]|uniref:hypothetical protein n=1 Tax=Moraxella lacunata TaxID=477 RepID=UPI003EE37A19